MTLTALGLDLSVTSTGVARADGKVATIKPSAGPDDPSRRLHEIIVRLDEHMRAGAPEVAVLEDIEGHWPKNTLRHMAELHGAVMCRLFELNIPYVHVNQMSLKKYSTGHGTASKDEMIDAARVRVTGVSGFEFPRNDDEADAVLLRSLALDHTAVKVAVLDLGDDLDLYRAEKLREWFGVPR